MRLLPAALPATVVALTVAYFGLGPKILMRSQSLALPADSVWRVVEQRGPFEGYQVRNFFIHHKRGSRWTGVATGVWPASNFCDPCMAAFSIEGSTGSIELETYRRQGTCRMDGTRLVIHLPSVEESKECVLILERRKP